MPAAHVRCEHDQMAQIASAFAQASEETGKLLQSVKSKYEPLKSGGWIGKGANAYFQEQESMVHPEMQRLQRALNQASQATRQISKVFEDAASEASGLLHV